MTLTAKITHLEAALEKTELNTLDDLSQFWQTYLGRKGRIKNLFEDFKDLPSDAPKKTFGQRINNLKRQAQTIFETAKANIEQVKHQNQTYGDLTLPSAESVGSLHPLVVVRNKIVEIFRGVGFDISKGPEIEDDWHNFSALNFPPNHPAREMQDTFFLRQDKSFLLRTHTSNVQIRAMTERKLPIRTLSVGRVYRNETISARSHCVFHQIEGIYVDCQVSFADLKNTVYYFARQLFGKQIKVRFRPSYFPFTEPSAEVDIYWGLKNETDYRLTKGTGWLEIMGCGMVDVNVLENCKIDSQEYTGFAFGMGIERIAMFLYQIDDIRHFTHNDHRFLKQFSIA